MASSFGANAASTVMLVNNWTSQIVLAYATGEILERHGQPVTYLESSVTEQWGALVHGVAHVQIEVWEGTMQDEFDRLTQSGSILDAGAHDATTREDWWYPLYVERLCPGLPDWQALKACSKLFSHDGKSKGTYIAGPWEKPDEARIRALGLDFNVQIVDGGDALWVKLKSAYQNKQPIILFNWTPNWVESEYAGRFVEFPQHHPDCESKPEWGVNPALVYDCGNPKGGWLKKAVWPGLPNQSPCAYDFIANVNFSNAHIAKAAAYVDVEKLSYKEAAKQWLADHKDVWTQWVPKSCL